MPVLFVIGAILYLVSPIIKRIESVLLVAVAALIAPLGELLLTVIVGIFMLLFCLFNIALTAISNFNRELLKKIIRKTYAGEILFGLLLLIVAFSMAFTILEEKKSSFLDALWYCFALITTIGFGDYAASSFLGRILSVILGIYGIIVVAIITSIIVNLYNEVKTFPPNELPQDDN